MNLGYIIKKYRYEHGKMSIQAFADKCGLSKAYISMLERNKNAKTGEPIVPSIDTFKKVARAMNMPVQRLLSEVDGFYNILPATDTDLKPISSLTSKILENFSSTFKMLRALGCFTPDGLANALEIPRSSIDLFEAGLQMPDLETLIKIADFFNVSLDYLIRGESAPKTSKHYALNAFYTFKVKDHSMEPRIHMGDIAVIRNQPDVESGDLAAVTIGSSKVVLRQVVKNSAGITLIAFNPAVYKPMFYTNEQIQELPVVISGKMVEFRARY